MRGRPGGIWMLSAVVPGRDHADGRTPPSLFANRCRSR